MNFIKSVVIQLLMLQFSLTIAKGDPSNQSWEDIIDKIPHQVTDISNGFWKFIEEYLCKICTYFNLEKTPCKKKEIVIPVIVILFILVFSIICLICSRCCCKKNENDESDESDVDSDEFIMGPDGQMYSTMNQEQMMQPQMLPVGMMYVQMFYPQMLQQGMLQQGMLQQGMLQQGMLQPEMQQPVTEKPRKKHKKKKRSSEHTNTNDDTIHFLYNAM